MTKKELIKRIERRGCSPEAVEERLRIGQATLERLKSADGMEERLASVNDTMAAFRDNDRKQSQLAGKYRALLRQGPPTLACYTYIQTLFPEAIELSQQHARLWPIAERVLRSNSLISDLRKAILANPDDVIYFDKVRAIDELWLNIETYIKLLPLALASIKQREPLAEGNKAKKEDAESLTRQIAKLWKHYLDTKPHYLSAMIEQHVGNDVGLKRTQLQDHLARARKLGLIPARHRRKKG